ncbi:hypothetical protein BJK06_00945 [Curtobacterium sp. BH-2-1-1]|nr:hypothetical protein BJK06_00945 [Curtobacterium sp. BH-2-1-1]
MRTAVAVLGAVALAAGIAALLLPHATLVAVVWVFGIYFVVAGGTLLVRAVPGGAPVWRRVALVVVGALVVVAGVLAIVHPPVGARWLAFAIGFAWLLEGITLLYAPDTGHRALTVVAAALSFVSGLVLITLPALGAVFVVAVVGGVLIVSGVVQLVIATTWGKTPGTRITENARNTGNTGSTGT